MINLRQKLLARLHCVKKELSLDDDAYRDILQAKTGHRSAAALDDHALMEVINHLGARLPPRPGKPRPARQAGEGTGRAGPWGWVNAAPQEKRGILWKLRRICINLGIEEAHQIAYTEGVAARVHGCERHLKMMTATELANLIGPLERTARYKATRAAPAAQTGNTATP